jgi:DNA ligase 1
MMLSSVAAVSAEVAAVSGRLAKIALLAGALGEADAGEVPIVVSWLSGELTQRQIGVGWAALRELPPAAADDTLTVSAVQQRFDEIGASAGPGSQARRRDLVADLFGRATEPEQRFLGALLSGGLRQGALAGVMIEAIARAANRPSAEVRRAAMMRGDLAVVAGVAISGGALSQFGLEVGRALAPMLAQTATDVDDAFARLGGRCAVETKLDGVRVQLHRSGDQVWVFTRTLDDVTERLPEVVEFVRRLPVHQLVADGEAIALRPDGRPAPFAVTSSRLGTRSAASKVSAQATLTPVLFDVLHVDGRDLLDEPAEYRFGVLDRLVPEANRVQRLIGDDPRAAERFLAETLSAGHEGVVVKSLIAPYEAGRRGAGWLKVKPVHTLDLVVLAVEWGSGRRKGWLSNIHLGARDPASGQFVMLGKTFKGMTDAMLTAQTERFLELADGPTADWVVRLRPEQVVEIAFDGVQKSSRYPGGVALRFARVLRYRDDKPATEADSIDMVRAFLPGP